MPLTDDLSRLMGFGAGADNNAEINIKVKPLGNLAQNAAAGVGAMAGNQQTQLSRLSKPAAGSQAALTGAQMFPSGPTTFGAGALGGAGPGLSAAPMMAQQQAPETVGGPTPGPAPVGGPASIVSGAAQGNPNFSINPQLMPPPAGFEPDEEYNSQISQLEAQYGKDIVDILEQIGWVDPQGNFVPGSLEQAAWGQVAEQERQRDLALQGVTQNAVLGGTVFSGKRAQRMAEASGPFDAEIGAINTALGSQIGGLTSDLGGMYAAWNAARNPLITAAMSRAAARKPVGETPVPPPAYQTPAHLLDPNPPPPPADWPYAPEFQGPYPVPGRRDLYYY